MCIRDRVDHQGVVFPTAKLLSKERGIGILGMLPVRIDGNQTEVAVPIQERDLVGALQYLEWQAAGVVARNAADDAQRLRIDRRRQVAFERCLACRREGELPAGQVLADVASWLRVLHAFPVPAEVGLAARGARRW